MYATRFAIASKQFTQKLASTQRTFASVVSSTEAAAPTKAWVPKRYQTSELKTDKAAHPIMPIMFAVGFAAMCMPLYASTFYNGINVSVDEKNSVLPVSDEPATRSTEIVKQAGAKPVSFLGLGKRMQSVQREGLGIDHEEWKKSKEAAKAEL